eukprot:s1_g1023.t1
MSTPLATTDLSDAHADTVAHVDPIFFDYGGQLTFHGPITTLKVFEDNALVRSAVEGPGDGRVLVVDGGGSMRCALFGGNLAQLAAQNGWAGVVIYGCVRDRDELEAEAVGIKAIGHHPRKSIKKGLGDIDLPVTFGGITFTPGAWLYADRDGAGSDLSALSFAEQFVVWATRAARNGLDCGCGRMRLEAAFAAINALEALPRFLDFLKDLETQFGRPLGSPCFKRQSLQADEARVLTLVDQFQSAATGDGPIPSNLSDAALQSGQHLALALCAAGVHLQPVFIAHQQNWPNGMPMLH